MIEARYGALNALSGNEAGVRSTQDIEARAGEGREDGPQAGRPVHPSRPKWPGPGRRISGQSDRRRTRASCPRGRRRLRTGLQRPSRVVAADSLLPWSPTTSRSAGPQRQVGISSPGAMEALARLPEALGAPDDLCWRTAWLLQDEANVNALRRGRDRAVDHARPRKRHHGLLEGPASGTSCAACCCRPNPTPLEAMTHRLATLPRARQLYAACASKLSGTGVRTIIKSWRMASRPPF